MEIVQKRPVLITLGALAGLLLGLLIGWVIWPVQYTGAGPQHLHERDQQNYLSALAGLYAFENNQARIIEALGRWDEADEAICELAVQFQAADPAEAARLNAMAIVLNGIGCPDLTPDAVPAPVEPDDEPRASSIWLICFLGLLFIGLVVGALIVWSRRSGMEPRGRYGYDADNVPESGPLTSDAADQQQTTIPLARFQSSYARGHDSYDESFTIENVNGEFLGECGVGISESIGADTPKNTTAFEIWLFDKNDIRTVTKVVMSDHAFFDDAIKAKLAPKGEPVLAREGETIVLETASLIINAEISEMVYGEGALPPQSFFERFTVELSAWAKEGEFEGPDIEGRVSELMR